MPAPQKASLALIQRSIVKGQYEKAGRPYLVNSRPYESCLPWLAAIVAGQNIGVGLPTSGAFVFRANQINEYFGYGRAAQGTGNTQVLLDDTTLSTGRRTNASEDFVIEGISATHRSTRIGYAPASITNSGFVDPDVVAALSAAPNSNGPVIYDPTALYVPAVIQSPVNLESALWEALKPHVFLEMVWGNKRTEQIGTLDEIPEGAAKSLLKASGVPSVDNRFKVPEGYLWRGNNSTDQDFIVRATLARAVVVPFAQAVFPSANIAAAGQAPTYLAMDVKMRLHGVAFAYPSRN